MNNITLIWGNALEILDEASWSFPLAVVDPDYKLDFDKQQEIHKIVCRATGGNVFVFCDINNPWPIPGAEHLFWVKPRRTVNVSVRYASNVELIERYGAGYFNTNRNWSQYFNWMDDIIEDKTIHPHQKPESLITRLIKNHSYPGALILDMFSGSGTGIVCARNSKRSMLAIEIDKEHVRNSILRFFGKTYWKYLDQILDSSKTPLALSLQGNPPKQILEMDIPVVVIRDEEEDIAAFFDKRSKDKEINEYSTSTAKPPKDAEEHRERVLGALRNFESNSSGIADTVTSIFGINPNWSTKTNAKVMEFLIERKRLGESVQDFSNWWWYHDFRGKKGQPPTTTQIMELWPQAFGFAPADAKATEVDDDLLVTG